MSYDNALIASKLRRWEKYLKEYPEYWWLSMGIRSYSKDMSKSMMRPPVNVIQFAKPCDDNQAIHHANEYMEKSISGIVNDFY